MAMVLSDCKVSVDSVDLSGETTSVAISISAQAIDVTAMGDDTRKHIAGIKDWSMSMEFAGTEALAGALFDKIGEVVPVEVQALTGAVSATNPSYEGDGLITEFTPISGAVGDARKYSLTLISAGPLARVVTP